jgi:hypothetical protein
MLEDAGAALATNLVSAYLSDQLEGSSSAAGGAGGAAAAAAAGGSAGATSTVGELAAALQSGAPGFFKDQDRQFFQVRALHAYVCGRCWQLPARALARAQHTSAPTPCRRPNTQANAKLNAAEAAGSAAERDALTKEALAGLLRVPQCVQLGNAVPRLAFLRQYEGVVQLVLACAALADPGSLAWRHSTATDTAAARAARDSCYAVLLEQLKPLLGLGAAPLAAPLGAAADAAGAGAGAGASTQGVPLTAAECKAAKDAIIEVCAWVACRWPASLVLLLVLHALWHAWPLVRATIHAPTIHHTPPPGRPSWRPRTSTCARCCSPRWWTWALTATCWHTPALSWVSAPRHVARLMPASLTRVLSGQGGFAPRHPLCVCVCVCVAGRCMSLHPRARPALRAVPAPGGRPRRAGCCGRRSCRRPAASAGRAGGPAQQPPGAARGAAGTAVCTEKEVSRARRCVACAGWQAASVCSRQQRGRAGVNTQSRRVTSCMRHPDWLPASVAAARAGMARRRASTAPWRSAAAALARRW